MHLFSCQIFQKEEILLFNKIVCLTSIIALALLQQILSTYYQMQAGTFSQAQEQDHFEILPSLTPEEEAQMQNQYKQRLITFYSKNKKYEIDYWYQSLKQYTYLSFPFELTNIEAYLLHCIYYEYPQNQELEQVKVNLVSKIDKLLAESSNERNKGRFFMKLSTRSPKDFCWDYRDQQQYHCAVQNLKKYLNIEKITKQTSPEKLNNTLYRFFLVNSHEKLLIRTGSDFIRIFSKSERIITDINDFSYLSNNAFEKIKQGKLSQEQKKQKLVNVWVRQWSQCKWQEEFRTFFYNYNLNAISQYDQRCFFSSLVNKKQEIRQRILDYFEKLKPHLKSMSLDKGVLDLIVSQDQMKVVEINIFDRDARASLFNWVDDQKVLKNGPLQIRLVEKQQNISKVYLGSIMGMIDKRSLDVIADALQQTGLITLWK